jgi:hypothetical protein
MIKGEFEVRRQSVIWRRAYNTPENSQLQEDDFPLPISVAGAGPLADSDNVFGGVVGARFSALLELFRSRRAAPELAVSAGRPVAPSAQWRNRATFRVPVVRAVIIPVGRN